jgi:predicted F0F1-ATPase subunit
MPPIGKSRKAKFHTVQDKIRKISGIAWAVLVPTALGIVVGLWMDTLWPAAAYSWVSMLWPIGALIGCLMAMIWVYQDPGTKS